MILSIIEAQIEQKEKELADVRASIFKLDKIINNLKEQQRRLLEKDTDLYYEIGELKDELQDNN